MGAAAHFYFPGCGCQEAEWFVKLNFGSVQLKPNAQIITNLFIDMKHLQKNDVSLDLEVALQKKHSVLTAKSNVLRKIERKDSGDLQASQHIFKLKLKNF